jgi:uncharacterized protein YacL
MLLWLLRGLFVAIILGMAIAAFTTFSEVQGGGSIWPGVRAALIILGVGGLVLFTDLWERNKQITTLSAIYFGLLLGLLLGWFFSLAVEQFLAPGPEEKNSPPVLVTRAVVTVICCYITISTLLQTKDEFRFIIPYVEFSKQVKGSKPLVLDTSVIIDGRVADLCDTRIVDAKLIVTRFVLQELQGIADSSDKLKRNRGRRGLDILKKLQTNPKIELLMHEGNVPEVREAGDKARVDERLVLFAKSVGGRVVTNDFNLNKIAQLQGVDVINLNEVANALKTVALPGELMTIKIVKPGDQPGQGVGYLDDGTMVVVEQGRGHIGTEVALTVTSVLQTPAGRMIFGRVDPQKPGGAPGTGEARALDK